jgi:uracil-DNA glycosylase
MLQHIIAEARACRLCAADLPLGPRPVFIARPGARLLIVGQAPGRRVHETGIPWNDPSGDNLRTWLGIGRDAFYGDARIAILPAGLCYPGTGQGGDLPPRPECAPRWHPRFRAAMPRVTLTLVIGQYAQA